MSEAAILRAYRDAVALAMPDANDWSDNPNDPRKDKLPAFVVSIGRDGAVPSSMKSAEEEVQLSVEVEIYLDYHRNDEGRDVARQRAELVRSEILGFAPLSALVDLINCTGAEVDLSPGEKRTARADVSFDVLATI